MRRRRKLKPSIADVVRAEMERQNLSQADLSRLCTVDRTSLSRWLTPGSKHGIGLDKAEQVMAVLGIRVVPPSTG